MARYGTVKEMIEVLKNKPQDEPIIMDLWSPEDVQNVAEELEVNLTWEQQKEIMKKVAESFDASYGISWDNFREELYFRGLGDE